MKQEPVPVVPGGSTIGTAIFIIGGLIFEKLNRIACLQAFTNKI